MADVADPVRAGEFQLAGSEVELGQLPAAGWDLFDEVAEDSPLGDDVLALDRRWSGDGVLGLADEVGQGGGAGAGGAERGVDVGEVSPDVVRPGALDGKEG